jgi:hypothetical protein
MNRSTFSAAAWPEMAIVKPIASAAIVASSLTMIEPPL